MGKTAEQWVIREAVPEDAPLLAGMIREMAAYEKLSHEVSADERVLSDQLFVKRHAEARILELGGEPVGYCIFFYNFSSFLGRAGLYIEDIYLRPGFRRRGHGREVFDALERLARAEGCGRMEWACLDWNTDAQDFYRKFGAAPVEGWSIFRKTLL